MDKPHTCRVRIKRCSNEELGWQLDWYKEKIGQEYDVHTQQDDYHRVSESFRWVRLIHKSDCEIITEPTASEPAEGEKVKIVRQDSRRMKWKDINFAYDNNVQPPAKPVQGEIPGIEVLREMRDYAHKQANEREEGTYTYNYLTIMDAVVWAYQAFSQQQIEELKAEVARLRQKYNEAVSRGTAG